MATYRLFLFILFAGVALRHFIAKTTHLQQWLQNRVEISTPLTSWTRVLEGIYLTSAIGHRSAYEGDLVHETPVMLRIYKFLLGVCEHLGVDTKLMFIVVDVINALFLYLCARNIIFFLKFEELMDLKGGRFARLFKTSQEPKSDDEKEKDAKERQKIVDTFLLKGFNKTYWSLFAVVVYLFNPYSVCSCAAQSTVLFHNMVLLFWLYFILNGNCYVAFLFLALHANVTVYSATLIAPSISFIFLLKRWDAFKVRVDKNQELTEEAPVSRMELTLCAFKYSLVFVGLLIAWFGFNLYLEDFNTRFIDCTYMFILRVPDLQPNLGLFWYFFTEMFEHFRLFFTYVFQLNAFIYALPLTVRMRNNSIINLLLQVGLIGVLKSYPNVGETGFYLSLLPVCAFLFPLMRNCLVYSCMLIASSVLAPVMFYLWLGNGGSGGGNANFYFAITLVHTIGQVFLLVDVMYACLKREFIKMNGYEVPLNADKSMATFALD